MSGGVELETRLVQVLKQSCPRVHADHADAAQPKPYVIWQGEDAGNPSRYLDGTPMPLRNARVTVAAWAESRLAALLLIRGIANNLCQDLVLTCRPESNESGSSDPGLGLYGATQVFDIWGPNS